MFNIGTIQYSAGGGGEGTLKDSYNTGDDNNYFNNAKWCGQTFTAGSSYKVYSVKLKLWKYGSPTDVTVRVTKVSDGTVMSTGTLDTSLLGSSPGAFVEISLTPSSELVSGTVYRVELAVSNEGNSSYIGRRFDNGGSYTGGTGQQSTNSTGTTWVGTSLPGDFMFETYN